MYPYEEEITEFRRNLEAYGNSRLTEVKTIITLPLSNFAAICKFTETSWPYISMPFMDRAVWGAYWHLLLYPNGCCLQHKDYVSIAIANNSPYDIEAKVSLSLRDAKNKLSLYTMNLHTRDYPSRKWIGVPVFVRRDVVMNPDNGLIWDDTISVSCTLMNTRAVRRRSGNILTYTSLVAVPEE